MTTIAVRSSENRTVAVIERGSSTVATRPGPGRAVVAAGLRGPKGDSGATLPPIPFSFGDASPRQVHLLTVQQLLVSLQVVVVTAFDGDSAALRLRTQSGDVLLDSDQAAPDFVATYEATPGAVLPAGTGIYLEITPGVGATAGAGFVVLNLN